MRPLRTLGIILATLALTLSAAAQGSGDMVIVCDLPHKVGGRGAVYGCVADPWKAQQRRWDDARRGVHDKKVRVLP